MRGPNHRIQNRLIEGVKKFLKNFRVVQQSELGFRYCERSAGFHTTAQAAETEKGMQMEEQFEAQVEEQAQPEKKAPKRVYIEFDVDHVAVRTNTAGQEFYSITLPRGTMIADVDYGNWNFTQTKMFPGKFHEATLVASFPNAEWEINLSHSYKDGDGEWQRETERVRVGALAEALARKSA